MCKDEVQDDDDITECPGCDNKGHSACIDACDAYTNCEGWNDGRGAHQTDEPEEEEEGSDENPEADSAAAAPPSVGTSRVTTSHVTETIAPAVAAAVVAR